MRKALRAALVVGALALACAAPSLAATTATPSAGPDEKLEACLVKQFGDKRLEAFLRGAPYNGSDAVKFKACGLTPQQAMALFRQVAQSEGRQGGGQSGSQGGGSQGGGAQGGSFSDQMSAGRCTGKGGRLTAPLVDPSKLSHIYPYGGMILAHITPVDHTYFYYPESSQTPVAAGSYLMTSPANGTVVSIGKLDTDFRLVLEISCDLYVIVIHVQELKGPLAKYNSLGRGQSSGDRIPVKAGELIADDSGSPGFDFSLHDGRVTLKGLNPAAYATTENWKVHTVDPARYWTPAIWSKLAAKLLRTAAPRVGKIDYDVKGTASGNWFEQGSNGYQGRQSQPKLVKPKDMRGYWDTHLALAKDPVDPSAIVISTGDYDGCACQFAVVGNKPAPEKVTAASGTVVYALAEPVLIDPKTGQPVVDVSRPPIGYKVQPNSVVAGLIAVRVNKDGTLTVEKLPGVTDPAQFTGFGPGAKTYVR
jgi:hypothetical protein